MIRADDATRAPRIGFLPQLVTLFAGLGVVVGGFVVVNTFSMLIAQRVRELGLLRALGASVRQVRRLVLGEAVVLGFVSAVIGALAGAGIGWAMLRIAEGVGFEPPEGPVVVSGGRIVFGIVLGLVVTCGAAVVPALRASRVAPVDAMREDPRPPAVAGAVRGVIAAGLAAIAAWLLGWAAFGTIRPYERGFQVAGAGALVLFAAVIALGPLVVGPLATVLARPFIAVLGGPGRLARSNADRHRRRSAATAAALMAGIALVTVAAVISSSAEASFSAVLQRNLLADYVVEPIGDRDVSVDLAAELRARAEVGDVVSAGRLDVSIDDDSEPLTVTDPDGLARMIDLRFREGDLDAVRSGELLVGACEMSQRGWRFGQELPVVFPTAGLVRMRIGAVLDEPVSGPGSAPINLLVADHVVADLGIERGDRLLWLSPADGAGDDDVARVLDEALTSYPGVEWNDRAGYIAREIGQIEQFLGVVAGLVGLSVVIAVLGIANTLLLGVLERTREIGLLRAVGMSRRQVRTMVQAEGAILAALGALAGIGLGLLLAFVFGRTWRGQGFDTFAVPVQLLALVVAGAVAVGVLAATIPARRAARVDVLEAIGVDFAATGQRAALDASLMPGGTPLQALRRDQPRRCEVKTRFGTPAPPGASAAASDTVRSWRRSCGSDRADRDRRRGGCVVALRDRRRAGRAAVPVRHVGDQRDRLVPARLRAGRTRCLAVVRDDDPRRRRRVPRRLHDVLDVHQRDDGPAARRSGDDGVRLRVPLARARARSSGDRMDRRPGRHVIHRSVRRNRAL